MSVAYCCLLLAHGLLPNAGDAHSAGTPFGKAKIMTAHNKFKSLDVEMLTQLCKVLRNRYGDEVSYDGASSLATLVAFQLLAGKPADGRPLSTACFSGAGRNRVWGTFGRSQHEEAHRSIRRGHCSLGIRLGFARCVLQ